MDKNKNYFIIESTKSKDFSFRFFSPGRFITVCTDLMLLYYDHIAVDKIRGSILRMKNEMEDFPIVLVGNKKDLAGKPIISSPLSLYSIHPKTFSVVNLLLFCFAFH